MAEIWVAVPFQRLVSGFRYHLLTIFPKLDPTVCTTTPFDAHDKVMPTTRGKVHRTNIFVRATTARSQFERSSITYVEPNSLSIYSFGLPVCQLIRSVRTYGIANIMSHGPSVIPHSRIHFLGNLVCGVKTNLHTVVIVRYIATINVDLKKIGAAPGR